MSAARPRAATARRTIRQASEAAFEAARRWRATFDAISDFICVLDYDGRIRRCNQAMASFLDLSFPDIIGQPCCELFQARLGSEETPFPSDIWRSGRRATLEFQLGGRWLRLVADPGGDDDLVMGGAVCIFSDVTVERQAEQERRLLAAQVDQQARTLEAILASSTHPMFVTDRDGRCIYASPSTASLMDCAPEELIGRTWQEMGMPSVVMQPFDRHREQVFRTGKSLSDNVSLPSPDGVRQFEYTLAPVRGPGGAVTAMAATVRDVSDQAAAEEALRQQASDLEEAGRQKDHFLALLAHELRNPLGAIRNATHLLRLAPQDADTRKQALDIIERQLQQQVRLVDDLLDLSRIGQGKIQLRLQPLDLGRLIGQTALDYRGNLESTDQTLLLDLPTEPVVVMGDPARLAQVLGNLLQNAGKFSPPGGCVTVRVTGGPQSAQLIVADTGEGIAPDLLPRVFQAFTQGEIIAARGREGLGLGLALVKGLVTLHNGDVRVESGGQGQGSVFTILLPLIPGDAVPPDVEAPAVPAVAPTRVLVIEDDPDSADTLRQLLTLCGHHVQVAASGPTGLAEARRFLPTVVLCDLGLPGFDGYQVAAELRREPATAAAHLVALSGFGQTEDRRRSREAGFDLHLTKPVDLDLLQRVLAALQSEPGTPESS